MIRSLYTSVSGMINSQTRMDIIGNNLANANTVAYKTSNASVGTAFDDAGRLASTTQPVGLSIGLGSQIMGTVRQFTQGALQRTDVNTDLAVQGNGFFTVESPDGAVYVTRAGNFVRDADGYLRTQNGMFVMGEMADLTVSPFVDATAPAAGGTAGYPADRIQIPQTVDSIGTASFSVSRDGAVTAIGADGIARRIGFIPLQSFSNPNALSDQGGNVYLVTAAAGTNEYFQANSDGLGFIQSGALELSNVDMAREFSEMIIVQRSFEANARTISTSDEMLQTVTNMKR